MGEQTAEETKPTVATVRAKFRVDSITEFHWHPGKEIKLNAVYDDGIEENRRYHEATPSGSMTITVNNPAARDYFQKGKSYYLDITEAPA